MMNRLIRLMLPALLAGPLGSAGLNAQETKTVPPGTPVTITVSPAAPSSPTVTLTQGCRKGGVTPIRVGCTHTGGGNIDVQQPSTDTIVITMTGVAVAYCGCKGAHAAHDFCLTQDLEVVFENTKVKKAKLTMEGRLIGLLRSHCKGGTAEVSRAHASLVCGEEIASIHMPDHFVAGGENLSVNDREGPCSVQIFPGKYVLHQTFHVAASAPKCLLPCKAPSSEFAPDPALDPLWISHKEPFKGASKKDFGFQITIKVAEETVEEAKNGNGDKKNGNGEKKNGNADKKEPEKKEPEKKELEKKETGLHLHLFPQR